MQHIIKVSLEHYFECIVYIIVLIKYDYIHVLNRVICSLHPFVYFLAFMACCVGLYVFLCWYDRSPPYNEPGDITTPAPKPCTQEHFQQQINELRNQVGLQILEALQKEKYSFEKSMDSKIQEERHLLYNEFSGEIKELRNSVEVSANELSAVISKVSGIESELNSNKEEIDRSTGRLQDGIDKIHKITSEVDDLEDKLSGFKQHLFHKSNFCF